jgi:hypothetical protein
MTTAIPCLPSLLTLYASTEVFELPYSGRNGLTAGESLEADVQSVEVVKYRNIPRVAPLFAAATALLLPQAAEAQEAPSQDGFDHGYIADMGLALFCLTATATSVWLYRQLIQAGKLPHGSFSAKNDQAKIEDDGARLHYWNQTTWIGGVHCGRWVGAESIRPYFEAAICRREAQCLALGKRKVSYIVHSESNQDLAIFEGDDKELISFLKSLLPPESYGPPFPIHIHQQISQGKSYTVLERENGRAAEFRAEWSALLKALKETSDGDFR